jgi:hypothetical protein
LSVDVGGPSGTAIAARATVATRATIARLDVYRLLFYAAIVMSGVSTATMMAGFADVSLSRNLGSQRGKKFHAFLNLHLSKLRDKNPVRKCCAAQSLQHRPLLLSLALD